ncbi:hypothetical protein PHISCL_08513 [Aspergillus sclerotialis]|uniref:Uncharacterized protein n=1 Tax=Aspergillus sclerotialis TaxID=2070753 RepID=A0A3A2Z968_9EURO|nr:hypothetical protein PHISCL_08513 [Aspergillus sclerotialis]
MHMTVGAANHRNCIGFVHHYVETIRPELEHYLKQKDNEVFGELDYLDKWHTRVSIILGKKLDDLRGETAKMLRLERFSKWFEDGDSWKSEYQERFLSNLRADLDFSLKYDAFLRDATERYHILILLYHRIRNGELRPISERWPPYTTWHSDAWFKQYPRGIPELTKFGFRSWIRYDETRTFLAYEKEVEQISRFSEDLDWWGWDALDVINKQKCGYYACSICESGGSPSVLFVQNFAETGEWPDNCVIFDASPKELVSVCIEFQEDA